MTILPSGTPPQPWSGADAPAPHPYPRQDPPGQPGPTGRPQRRVNVWRVVWLTVAIVVMAASGIGMLLFLGWRMGPVALIVGIGAAVLPVPLLVYCFLWLQRYRPAPVWYLVGSFSWGACMATLVSLVVNTGSSLLLERYHMQEDLVAVLVAPFIEETTKAAGPVVLFWVLFHRRRRTHSGIIDGIVFCGLSATGFAMVENILYIGGLGYAQGVENGGALVGAAGVVKVFFARIVMAGFAHPLFTLMTGIGIGIAAREANRVVRWLAPIGGWLVAMMLHGSWNLMSVLVKATQQAYVMLYGYVAVMMPIFFCMVGFALWLRSSEGRLTERVLAVYARAGWLSPPELAALGTLGRRASARRWAKRVAGDPGARAMRAFQFDATKLALLRDGLHRGIGTEPADLPHTLAEEQRLLGALMGYRTVFTGRDPQVPPARWDGSRYHITFPDGVVRPLDQPEQAVVPVPVTFVAQPLVGYPYR